MNIPDHEQHLNLQDHLKTLHQMTLDLSEVDSLDDLYRRAIEYGSQQLGFDRLGVFILNPADETWTGTFGVDTDGQLRDERHHQEGFSVLVKLMWHDLIAKRDQVILRKDVVLYDSGSEVGIGWHAVAALWRGNEIFGLLFVDNLITQRPQRPYEADLISLFSSTLAHLITRKEIEDELRASQKQYLDMFENMPAVLLVEDYSGVRSYIDTLRDKGIQDFRAYFSTQSEAVAHCASLINIIDANRAALDFYGVTTKYQLPKVLAELLTNSQSFDLFSEEISALAEGNLSYHHTTRNRTQYGKPIDLDLKLRIAPDVEATWSRVYVTICEIDSTDSD